MSLGKRKDAKQEKKLNKIIVGSTKVLAMNTA
jgi:hypothetical protein